jgi:hypothetical protein
MSGQDGKMALPAMIQHAEIQVDVVWPSGRALLVCEPGVWDIGKKECELLYAAGVRCSQHAWQRQLLLSLLLHDGAALRCVGLAAPQALGSSTGAALLQCLECRLHQLLNKVQLQGGIIQKAAGRGSK